MSSGCSEASSGATSNPPRVQWGSMVTSGVSGEAVGTGKDENDFRSTEGKNTIVSMIKLLNNDWSVWDVAVS